MAKGGLQDPTSQSSGNPANGQLVHNIGALNFRSPLVAVLDSRKNFSHACLAIKGQQGYAAPPSQMPGLRQVAHYFHERFGPGTGHRCFGLRWLGQLPTVCQLPSKLQERPPAKNPSLNSNDRVAKRAQSLARRGRRGKARRAPSKELIPEPHLIAQRSSKLRASRRTGTRRGRGGGASPILKPELRAEVAPPNSWRIQLKARGLHNQDESGFSSHHTTP